MATLLAISFLPLTLKAYSAIRTVHRHTTHKETNNQDGTRLTRHGTQNKRIKTEGTCQTFPNNTYSIPCMRPICTVGTCCVKLWSGSNYRLVCFPGPCTRCQTYIPGCSYATKPPKTCSKCVDQNCFHTCNNSTNKITPGQDKTVSCVEQCPCKNSSVLLDYEEELKMKCTIQEKKVCELFCHENVCHRLCHKESYLHCSNKTLEGNLSHGKLLNGRCMEKCLGTMERCQRKCLKITYKFDTTVSKTKIKKTVDRSKKKFCLGNKCVNMIKTKTTNTHWIILDTVSISSGTSFGRGTSSVPIMVTLLIGIFLHTL